MKRIILAIFALLVCVPAGRAQAPNQTTATLASFPAPPGTGFSYASSLLQGSDGNFYGTHNEIIPITIGGITTYTYTGTVFCVAPDGTLTTVAVLPTIDRTENQLGFGPYSGLVQDASGNFYGTTYVHGATPDALAGMVYQLTPDFLTLTTLHYFSGGPDGGKPHGNLIIGADGNFYGTTYAGGTSGYGTIFSISQPDAVFTTLYSFTGGSDGANPVGTLLLGADGNLYGTTTAGGANGGGTVFQITIPAGLLTPLFSFAASDGNSPFAGLVQGLDGNFYGRTVNPAAMHGDGTIFMLTPPPDNNLTTLFTFPNGTDDGISSVALLQGRDGRLYGTTGSGGTPRTGTVFAMTPADGALTTLYTFNGLSGGTNGDGAVPVASLIQAPDGSFYGTTSNGGANRTGTVFAIAPVATLTTLYNFSGGTDGNVPLGIVQGQDLNFYGVTAHSAAGIGAGTVFVVPPGGTPTTPTTLHTFAPFTRPNNGLIQAGDANLYGTASEGGAFGAGFVYRMVPNPNATTTVLYSFSGGNDGGNPNSGVIQANDGNFYGTTVYGGGPLGGGTVFQMTPDGNVTTLHSFQGGMDGFNPIGPLLQASDGNFYGTTSREGGFTQVGGTVFQMVGLSAPVTLHAFDGNMEGPSPIAGLVEAADGLLWGTTHGQYQRGHVFKIAKDATVYNRVHIFDNSEGDNSGATLLLASDGNFYGILGPAGSTVAGKGIIYKITPAGLFFVIHRFSGPDGNEPYPGALVEGADGFLYGVTGGGGTSGNGTFFRLDRG